MEACVHLCHSLGLPVWIAPLLLAAKRLRSDHASRKKVYRLLQRKLMDSGVGVLPGTCRSPTYVYPEQLKKLVRLVFPEDVCSYQDPCHEQVVHVTVEDLHRVSRDPR